MDTKCDTNIATTIPTIGTISTTATATATPGTTIERISPTHLLTALSTAPTRLKAPKDAPYLYCFYLFCFYCLQL